MKHGMHIRLHYWNEEHKPFRVKELLPLIVQWCDELHFYEEYRGENYEQVINLVVKSTWVEYLRNITYVVRDHYKQWLIDSEEFDACEEHGCLKKVAAYQCALFAQEHFYLHDRHGEDFHNIHQYCIDHHITPGHKQLLKTLSVLTLTEPKEEYWEKIVSWQFWHYFLAQKIVLEYEVTGDCGEHFDYQRAWPYVGPFRTREEAIEAARKDEE